MKSVTEYTHFCEVLLHTFGEPQYVGELAMALLRCQKWVHPIAVSDHDSHIPVVGWCQWTNQLFTEDLKDALDDPN